VPHVADLSRVNQWIDTRLRNDRIISDHVADRVYSDEVPQGALPPMVVYAYLGGADKLLTARARTSSALYLIRAIAEGSSYDDVESLADRIEAALTVLPNTGVVVRDVQIMSCAREQPHQRKDAQFGKPSVYMGGFYRVRFQPIDQ
jgi:hypothetical protein